MKSKIRAPFRSTIFMVLAAAGLNISLTFLRFFREDTGNYITPIVSTVSMSLMKYFCVFILSCLFVFIKKVKLEKIKWGSSLAFGMSESLASLGLILSGITVPLALNSILGDLHILLTPVILYFWSSTTEVNNKHLIYSGIGFLGAVLFASPQLNHSSELSSMMIFPLISSLLWCLCGLLSEKMSRIPLAFVQIVTAFSGFALSLILALIFQKNGFWNFPWMNPWILLSLLFAVLAQLFFIASLASGDILAALIAAPTYAVFGGLIGYTLFNEKFGIFEWTGFILVILSVFIYQKNKHYQK